ncbi:hypothetical protein IJG12_00110 [Candidatus Saccharibacteria bacterium]|nr:hypothetical protein [Candidatus Saccharibacteria bacterium]
MKIRFKLIVSLTMLIGVVLCCSGSAFADVIYGDGTSSSNAEFKGCDSAVRWQNVQTCSSNHGGASWHVFSTAKKPIVDTNAPSYADRPILTASLAGGWNEGAISACDSGYYIAFVYDGWYGAGANWGSKTLFFYGPLAWKTYQQTNDSGVAHTPIYHKAGGYSAAQITNAWIAGSLANGVRISGEYPTDGYKSASNNTWQSTEATQLYRMYSGNAAAEIPAGTGWFCYTPPRVTLTAYARALPQKSDGTYDSMNSGHAIDTQTVYLGRTASVDSNRYAPVGWTWKKWGSQGKCANQGHKCNVVMDDNHNVYAYYEKNEWQAQSVLSGDASATAGYSNATVSKTGFINNCDPVSGCQVTFNHKIKRVKGSGTTAYTVSRTSNLTRSDDSAKGVDANSNVASGYSNDDGSEKNVNTSTFTLYPGMIVCERITYKSFNVPGSQDVYSEVCASALGKAQPNDPPSDTPEDPNVPSGDSSFVNIKVRNDSITAYKKYMRTVYAKPTDKIKYRAVYNPRLQYTYKLKTTVGRMQMKIDGAGSINGNGTALGTLFGAYRSPGWNNDYAIGSTFADSDRNLQHSVNNNPGDIAFKTEEIPGTGGDYYVVESSNVGHSLDETIALNNGIVQTRSGGSNDNKTTPWQVEFSKANGSDSVSVANVKVASAPSRTASALVPYNYRNTAEITNKNKVVFAGETLKVTHNYIINPKTNTLTSPSTPYITSIGDPQWKIKLRVVGGDSYWTSIHKPSNDDYIVSDSEMYSKKTVKNENTINIPDVAAGTTICVSSAVYPKDSYSDGNIKKNAYDVNNANSWSYSPEVCFTVAKRPSLQVWGGNIFSRGKIATSNSAKRNLLGYEINKYQIESDNGIHVFGSFGELGLIASGEVTGLASGASTGYGNNINGVLMPNPFAVNNASNAPLPGGGSTNDINRLSQLTFANYPRREVVGRLGKTSTTTNLEEDKNNILGKFIKELDSPNTDSHVVLNDRNKAQADGTYYYYSDNDLEVGNNATEVSVASSTIQMVHSDNTVYVRGNIVYGDTYKKYSELPKLVLYGKNVVIDCNVTRIDALIIADEKVVTCNNYEGININNTEVNLKNNISNHINDAANSQQLKINGAVVAKTLIANRTYGAATGANSIVPAEIINFDPTLYMWGGLGNEEGSDGDLKITMLRELAPRK